MSASIFCFKLFISFVGVATVLLWTACQLLCNKNDQTSSNRPNFISSSFHTLLLQSLKQLVPPHRAGSGVRVESVWQWALCVTDMLTALMELMRTTLSADTERLLVSHTTQQLCALIRRGKHTNKIILMQKWNVFNYRQFGKTSCNHDNILLHNCSIHCKLNLDGQLITN